MTDNHGKGWSQLLCNEMEVRKLIGKPLKPARPIRRVDNGNMGMSEAREYGKYAVATRAVCTETRELETSRDSWDRSCGMAGSLLIDFHAECDSFKEDLNRNYSLRCSPSKLNGLVHEAQIPKSSKKSEEIQSKCNEGRITYSRDDLLQLSSSSVSRVKPKYLPDHPVILQHPCSDLQAGPMSPTIHPS
ncbi:uncharacterized protein C8orf88 homolog [Gastrophryne carolinensis]